VRQIGSAYSPSFGYQGTPSFDLTTAVPYNGTYPLPVPAGVYDATLVYNTGNSQCASSSSTLSAAFIVQVGACHHHPATCLTHCATHCQPATGLISGL
jgi:hypothetical protein